MTRREDPPVHQRRLAWWEHLWRDALATLVSFIGWVALLETASRPGHDRLSGGMELLLGAIEPVMFLVFLAVVHLRHRWPIAISVGLSLMNVGLIGAAGPATLALASVATRRRWRETVPAAVLYLLCGQGYVYMPWGDYTNSDPEWIAWVMAVIFTALTVAVGFYSGARRELLANLRLRAETAEREWDLRATQARASERERIAREMHDVLAHRISLVSMHAGALAYREDLPREQVREVAGIIQDNAHRALAELRTVLGVLRGSPADGIEAPQPTLAALEQLIEEARAGGDRIELICVVEGAPSADIGRHAYRIVQEALTNARKHAPGAAVRVQVRGDAREGLSLRVSNSAILTVPGPGTGAGLVGLAERAELCGGWLRARHEGTDFTVSAWLPWREGA